MVLNEPLFAGEFSDAQLVGIAHATLTVHPHNIHFHDYFAWKNSEDDIEEFRSMVETKMMHPVRCEGRDDGFILSIEPPSLTELSRSSDRHETALLLDVFSRTEVSVPKATGNAKSKVTTSASIRRGLPSRPRNCFIIYRYERHSKLKAERPELDVKQICKWNQCMFKFKGCTDYDL